MATWAPTEVASLLQAWREAIDTPMQERSKISNELFRRFVLLVGTDTLRSEGAVSFKQGSLKNIVQLVSAFNDRDKWFAFSYEQKKRWFKLVNRRSYKFIDIDRAMFNAVAELIRLQDESPNVRSRGNANDRAAIAAFSELRVRLRRNAVDGEWEVRPESTSELSPDVASDTSASRKLPLQLPLALQPRGRRIATPTMPTKDDIPVVPASRDFQSLLAPGASDARSIFAPASPKKSTAANVLGKDGAFSHRQPSASALAASREGLAASRVLSRQRDGFELEVESDESDSSVESDDSDDEMRDESRAVAARLQSLDAKASALFEATTKRATTTRRIAAPTPTHKATAMLSVRPDALLPSAASTAKPQVPSKAPDGVEGLPLQTNSELVAIASVLEKQAQELKQLLAEAKEERALDLQRRAKDADERRQLIDEIAKLRAERQQWDQVRTEDAAARSRVLEAMALDREERAKFEEALALDRAERQAYGSVRRPHNCESSHRTSGDGEAAARLSALTRAAAPLVETRDHERAGVGSVAAAGELAPASRDDSRDSGASRRTRSKEQPKEQSKEQLKKRMKLRRSQ